VMTCTVVIKDGANSEIGLGIKHEPWRNTLEYVCPIAGSGTVAHRSRVNDKPLRAASAVSPKTEGSYPPVGGYS
jgi:hypothetical protein